MAYVSHRSRTGTLEINGVGTRRVRAAQSSRRSLPRATPGSEVWETSFQGGFEISENEKEDLPAARQESRGGFPALVLDEVALPLPVMSALSRASPYPLIEKVTLRGSS